MLRIVCDYCGSNVEQGLPTFAVRQLDGKLGSIALRVTLGDEGSTAACAACLLAALSGATSALEARHKPKTHAPAAKRAAKLAASSASSGTTTAARASKPPTKRSISGRK